MYTLVGVTLRPPQYRNHSWPVKRGKHWPFFPKEVLDVRNHVRLRLAVQKGETLAVFPRGVLDVGKHMYYACGCDAAPLSIPEPFLAIQKGETLALFPRGGSGRREASVYA